MCVYLITNKGGDDMEMRADKLYNRIGIYGIKNMVNNHIYIGKTGMNFGDRWDSHRALLRAKKHFNQYLQYSWNKYGEENFSFIIVEECATEELDDKERYYIQLYRDMGLAYNFADGGEGGSFLGKHLSEETKRKIGDKNRVHMTGRRLSEETRKKMSESQNKRYANWTEEDRVAWGQLTSERARGYKWNDESRDKMIGNKNGATHTEDEIREIRRMYEVEKKSCREIADYFHESYDFIYGIVKYKRWTNI